MKCYFCATPYHIIAASTLASGIYKNEKGILVLYNHFENQKELKNKLLKCDIFDQIILYNYSNRNIFSNIKRVFNVFIQDKVIINVANNPHIDEYVFFTLDFMAATYIQKYKKNKKAFVRFGDDGMGTYFNGNCYIPRQKPAKMLKMLGRYDTLQEIKDVYAYRPEYNLRNTRLNFLKIEQNKDTYNKIDKLMKTLWPLNDSYLLCNKIVFYEQPYPNDTNNEIIKKTILLLHEIEKKTNKSIVIKMHPRSHNEHFYSDFQIVNTKAPFESILWQCRENIENSLMLSINSTVVYSPYLFDCFDNINLNTILLSYMFYGVEDEACNFIIKKLQEKNKATTIFMPKTIGEINSLILNMKK